MIGRQAIICRKPCLPAFSPENNARNLFSKTKKEVKIENENETKKDTKIKKETEIERVRPKYI